MRLFSLLAVLALGAVASLAQSHSLQVGTGIYDVTGPAAEMVMMGYANMKMITKGLHTRLRSRAYVITDGDKRVAFVSSDLCMVFQSVKIYVVKALAARGLGMYTNENVMLSGTHTHSGPGGTSFYTIYDISILGFQRDNFDAQVNGIVEAIASAHANLQPASIKLAAGLLFDANINRSPTAYPANPAEERARYEAEGDTEKGMTLLRIDSASGTPLGMINWFAVHCTSMNNTNALISSDNKGYASLVFEQTMNGAAAIPGEGPFVAAFAQANSGDVSPNTMGAKCPDGSACDGPHSSCGGKNEGCIAAGPGKNMVESTAIIGQRQVDAATALYAAAAAAGAAADITAGWLPAGAPLVDYRHMHVDMTTVRLRGDYGHAGNTTCKGAMGYAFAAGTTDGPGDFDFVQSTTSKNPLWNIVSNLLHAPSAAQTACQAPKPILLDVGDISPIPWVPDVVPVQLFRIGKLVILGAPTELTTMAGRRLKASVRAAFGTALPADATIVIAGLSNAYSSYTTTREEYGVQRYEGASTLYGPAQLQAYQELYGDLARAMAAGVHVSPGPDPRDIIDKMINVHPGVLFDTVAYGKRYGDVDGDAAASYTRGSSASASFHGAHLRNNLMTQSSFMFVQRLRTADDPHAAAAQSQQRRFVRLGGHAPAALAAAAAAAEDAADAEWESIRTDAHFDTRVRWERVGASQSRVHADWDVPTDAVPGVYRFVVQGVSKSWLGAFTPYSGASRTFTVV